MFLCRIGRPPLTGLFDTVGPPVGWFQGLKNAKEYDDDEYVCVCVFGVHVSGAIVDKFSSSC